MLRPGFPRLSHPEVAHAIPSVGFMAQVYRRVRLLVSPTIVGVQLTDQQRTAQAPSQGRTLNQRKILTLCALLLIVVKSVAQIPLALDTQPTATESTRGTSGGIPAALFQPLQ